MWKYTDKRDILASIQGAFLKSVRLVVSVSIINDKMGQRFIAFATLLRIPGATIDVWVVEHRHLKVIIDCCMSHNFKTLRPDCIS